jgi:flagellar motor protein MotB
MGLWSIMKTAPVAVAPVREEFIQKFATTAVPTPPGLTDEQHEQQQLQAKQERVREQKRYQRVRARAREIQQKRAVVLASVSSCSFILATRLTAVEACNATAVCGALC